MAVSEVVDSVRRIVERWVNTYSPLTEDASPGDTVINVDSTIRFQEGDEVMLYNPTRAEYGHVIDEVIDNTRVRLASPVINSLWTVQNAGVLRKTINNMFVHGVYVGDPNVIPRFPAITVNPTGRNSEWLTLESTKERYEIEISTYILDSTHEDGFRFLMNITDTIQLGLKRNIFPLLQDYETTTLLADGEIGDQFLKVADSSIFERFSRILIEDKHKYEEHMIDEVIDSTTVKIFEGNELCQTFLTADTTVIKANRFVFNSWPTDIDYGKVHQKTLMKASTIRWFAEEEEWQILRRQDTQLS